ncbi:hypothetical protein K438DRAFT_1820048 [Mycena galopus ATCC 62051]|nr:hypothetical protein K438DRAFT_1820048 [Mycena galopus ATCC 62051]
MDSYYTGNLYKYSPFLAGLPTISANATNTMVNVNGCMQAFYDGCNQAGLDNCLFYASSSSEVTAKLDALTSSVKEQPIPVVTPDSHGLVDFTFLRNAILAA